MARPLRIEFPGAVYHVTSRGDRREPIFVDDTDRRALLDVLGTDLDRFDAIGLARSLMGNRYHFVIQTRLANPSLLIRAPQWRVRAAPLSAHGFSRQAGLVDAMPSRTTGQASCSSKLAQAGGQLVALLQRGGLALSDAHKL